MLNSYYCVPVLCTRMCIDDTIGIARRAFKDFSFVINETPYHFL